MHQIKKYINFVKKNNMRNFINKLIDTFGIVIITAKKYKTMKDVISATKDMLQVRDEMKNTYRQIIDDLKEKYESSLKTMEIFLEEENRKQNALAFAIKMTSRFPMEDPVETFEGWFWWYMDNIKSDITPIENIPEIQTETGVDCNISGETYKDTTDDKKVS